MSDNTSRSQSGGNRSHSNSNRNRGGGNRSGSNRGGGNRGGSNRGGGNRGGSNRSGGNRNRNRDSEHRGDPSSRPPRGGSSQRPFVKQKVPRRTKPPTLWEKFLSLFGFGPTQRKAPPQRAAAQQSSNSRPQNDAPRSRPKAKNPQKSRDRAPREERPREKRPPEKVEVTGPRLYVGNLSYDTGEGDLEKLFSEVGEVASAEVVCHQRNQRSKGYAFVQMADIDAAKRAVDTLHDREFMGRPILVSGAKSAGPKARENA